MYFEFTDTFYVSEEDFDEMVRLCKEKHMTVYQALSYVVNSWNDADFYYAGLVEDQIIAELRKRLGK